MNRNLSTLVVALFFKVVALIVIILSIFGLVLFVNMATDDRPNSFEIILVSGFAVMIMGIILGLFIFALGRMIEILVSFESKLDYIMRANRYLMAQFQSESEES